MKPPIKPLRLLVAALLLATPLVALADAIRLIVLTAPGGGTDGYFRVLAKGAEPFLKEPLVIVNVPGAGGTIGVAQMVRAAKSAARLELSLRASPGRTDCWS